MTADGKLRVLVFRPGQLGDTIMALPAVAALREWEKTGELVYVYDRQLQRNWFSARELLDSVGLCDGSAEYAVGATPWGKLVALTRNLRLLRRLRRERHDVIINLYSNRVWFRRWFFRAYFSACRPVRYVDVDPQTWATIEKQPRPLPGSRSVAEFCLQTVKGAGLETVPSAARMMHDSITSKLRQVPRGDLARLYGLPEDRPWVALGLGSKMPAKVWPLERYLEVARLVGARGGFFPVVTGGADGVDLGREFLRQAGYGRSLAGQLGVTESLDLLQHCACYLGNDTGSMHLAVMAGLRCVAIFSARDLPGLWYPVGEGHVVFRQTVPCEGCMLEVCVNENMRCLKEIAAVPVADAVAGMLWPKTALTVKAGP